MRLGNEKRLMTQGKGSIKLEIVGVVQIVIDVYYILELRSNLLNIRELQEKGLKVMFEENLCKVYHKRKGLILKFKMF